MSTNSGEGVKVLKDAFAKNASYFWRAPFKAPKTLSHIPCTKFLFSCPRKLFLYTIDF